MGMSVAAPEETWLSIADAADKLGVHPRTLRRYIGDGKLTAHRLSSQIVRIRPEDLDAFLADNIKMVTGTGTCYVPRVVSPKKRKARVRRATQGVTGQPF